jgi:prolipoprotein diacylglyceryl transferase
VAGLIIAMYLFTKSRGIPFLEGADRFSFSAALGATVVRIGNLFNSEIVGRKVPDQSWGMRFPRNPPDHALNPIPLRYPSQLYEIALGISVFVGLLIADRLMGKEKRPRGAMIAWFFALYFTGRLFTEFYKEIEALDPNSPISMGQYLSVLPALLGWYGVYWTMKRKQPSGWGEALPASDEGESDEADEDDADDEEEEGASARRRKAASVADDGDEDEDEDEQDDEHPVSTKKSGALDPDVEAEFEAGKLKKIRQEPTE